MPKTPVVTTSRRFVCAVLMAALFLPAMVALVASPVLAAPGPDARPPLPILPFADPPSVGAEAWVLYDASFDVELGAEDPDTERAMASTTKMMTALVALERADLDELVTISQEAADAGEAEIGVVAGETWTLKDLLTAMLVESGNDAAVAVAEHVGGTVGGFVRLMNERSAALGLAHTRFTNPHGLDEPGHYSTAHDLLIIAKAAMEHDTFADIVATRTARFPDDPDGNERVARTTNQLLASFPGAVGVKTGFTDEAESVLVAAAERDGRRIYAVVMGSQGFGGHFVDASALLEYGFSDFGLVRLVAAGDEYARRREPGRSVAFTAPSSLQVFLERDAADQVILDPEFAGEGAVLVVRLENQELGRVTLEGEPAGSLPGLREAGAWASRYWDWLWSRG